MILVGRHVKAPLASEGDTFAVGAIEADVELLKIYVSEEVERGRRLLVKNKKECGQHNGAWMSSASQVEWRSEN